MEKVKELGQVMTPPELASYMIGLLHLTEEDKKNALFLENSCGNGTFIKELIKDGVPANHIFACDIDKEIISSVFEILPKENIFVGSAFDKKEWLEKFDYVIGNPPYVRIHNLEKQFKEYLQKNYSFCYGMTDLYIAFFELGLKQLKENGTLCYITPNSYVKNEAGKYLRKYIEEHKALLYFEDFENENKFPSYSTYSCITILKEKAGDNFPWLKKEEKIGLPFTSIQNGLATLADKIFIANDFSFLEEDYVFDVFKASTGEYKKVVIPPREECDLKKCPKTYEYLFSNKEKLLARKLQGDTKWFEIGRKQGMKFFQEEKIAISTIISEEGLRISRLPKNIYVYSGLYATSGDLSLLEEQLSSKKLVDFLWRKGKTLSGGYKQINATLLKEY